MTLIEQLISVGKIKTPQIMAAFLKVPRLKFMPKGCTQEDAEVDAPYPIGEGQTISQPTTVAFMLEQLQPKQGHKVLDIGFGSGWTTALLAEIVGAKGKVYAVEIIPKLFEFGRENVIKAGYKNVEFLCGDASGGWPQKAPFDRILGGASAPQIPQPLKDQLKIGGVMVLPVQDTVIKIKRKSAKKFQKTIFPYFAFVPLKGRFGQKI